MRILVTGLDIQKVADIARHVTDTLEPCSCRVMGITDNFPNTPANDDPDARLISAIGMTMADYTTACHVERVVHFSNHLLVAANMPLLGRYGEGLTMPRYVESGEAQQSVWDACRHVLRNVYSTSRFDYVFRVGSMPTADLLGYYGMHDPIEITRAREIADVLRREVALWSSM